MLKILTGYKWGVSNNQALINETYDVSDMGTFIGELGAIVDADFFTWKLPSTPNNIAGLVKQMKADNSSKATIKFDNIKAKEQTGFNPDGSIRFSECLAPSEVKASETQVGGSHYTDLKIQPLELTYANFGYIGLKAAIYTKVNKYMTRKKDDEIGQLKKARHCLDFLIEKAELEND
jgi:hypothetical protein